MSGPSSPLTLDARVASRVHPGLTIDATIRLGDEIGVLFGPSGAGKSTLLRLLAGLVRPDSGLVTLAGETLFDSARGVDVPLRRRRIGMIFQDDLLFPHLDVAGNVGFGLAGTIRADRERRVAEVAASCGIASLLGRHVETLSGGERQRVGLARALAPRPRLLLCDEPVSALDLPGRRTLLDRLRAVQRAEGMPVLYVTHSPSEAITLGTRLFLLDGGRLVAEGPPAEVLAGTRRAEFLHLEGVRNVFSGRVAGHGEGREWTRLDLDGGTSLIAAYVDAPPGAAVSVEVDGDDVLLAAGPVAGLSARNQVEGRVEAIAVHGREAEVVVMVGGLRWLVGTLASTPDVLALAPGRSVHLVIKARSVRVEYSLD
ncbi:molybdenum ABC transporter ATP-binding protein [Planctomyces sp. SH-PL62]|uniref:molybdenum ABC transporter ATP-binding protein n=1 Tax=Planctomyces sp. SH-PL62 TaxID=1636152 RepID=UPI00078B546A|nr:ATP-binding cassette domain-containing protein [Planctomyces sp. SH-PL62]AMV36624.1 Fe(3+) ions import ATP-binding protein FbpC [Planctomyces sp. SH-PL62]